MKFSLSTNWCNRRFETGEEIAEKAIELGFDELELGFHTTFQQVDGFRRVLERIPVGSIHAFCPVPISAPQGYPELYQLASFDEEGRKMARLQVSRNIEFASSIGADTVVLHAGRVLCPGLLRRWRERKREKRGQKLLEVLRGELEALTELLEKCKVTLALENLPYYEGFPNEAELKTVLGWDLGGRVKGWFDTGHHRVREANGWANGWTPKDAASGDFVGMHLNDVKDKTDDHLAPGEGSVDFAALRPFAENLRHLVFEPAPDLDEMRLRKGLDHIRNLWK